MSDCPICGRDIEAKFCHYHQTAFNNLREKHEKWEIAAGLSWEEYLEKVGDLENTGRWISEVIEFLTLQGDL
ncbi:MAG: hypothetical protein RTV72_05750 [Candidatus Thorarchaeota archaeon]